MFIEEETVNLATLLFQRLKLIEKLDDEEDVDSNTITALLMEKAAVGFYKPIFRQMNAESHCRFPHSYNFRIFVVSDGLAKLRYKLKQYSKDGVLLYRLLALANNENPSGDSGDILAPSNRNHTFLYYSNKDPLDRFLCDLFRTERTHIVRDVSCELLAKEMVGVVRKLFEKLGIDYTNIKAFVAERANNIAACSFEKERQRIKYYAFKRYTEQDGFSCITNLQAFDDNYYIKSGCLETMFCFESDELDSNNWVVNFGEFRKIKDFLTDLADHKIIIRKRDIEHIELMALNHDFTIEKYDANMLHVDEPHNDKVSFIDLSPKIKSPPDSPRPATKFVVVKTSNKIEPYNLYDLYCIRDHIQESVMDGIIDGHIFTNNKARFMGVNVKIGNDSVCCY